MNRFTLLLSLILAAPLFAQMQETVHANAYSSPSDAATAMAGYLAPENVDLIPVRIYSPFFGMQRTQYALVFQPAIGEMEECGTFPGSAPPPITFISGACSHTLTTWAVRQFSTDVAQRAFYGGLSGLQRGTAYILTSPAEVAQPYLILYQIEATMGPCP